RLQRRTANHLPHVHPHPTGRAVSTPLPKNRREHWTGHVVNPDGSRTRLALDADIPGNLTWDADGIDAYLSCHGTPPDLLTGQWVDLALHVNGTPHHWPPLVPSEDDAVY